MVDKVSRKYCLGKWVTVAERRPKAYCSHLLITRQSPGNDKGRMVMVTVCDRHRSNTIVFSLSGSSEVYNGIVLFIVTIATFTYNGYCLVRSGSVKGI